MLLPRRDFLKRVGREIFWAVLILAVLVVIGSALLLLRTARKPRIPDSVKPKPYRDDDEEEW